ncbi:hypothetical protein AB0M45_32860 [Nocardia sp. NPDC051787]|uniref:hypothetical protein n=1 Tax=Nocardia sp. NPDC051787 TaxID=3155415 RepID=UPI0034373B5F
MPEQLHPDLLVHADGPLAEHLCRVRLINLTVEHAHQLCWLHRHHPPDDYLVHLAPLHLLADLGQPWSSAVKSRRNADPHKGAEPAGMGGGQLAQL